MTSAALSKVHKKKRFNLHCRAPTCSLMFHASAKSDYSQIASETTRQTRTRKMPLTLRQRRKILLTRSLILEKRALWPSGNISAAVQFCEDVIRRFRLCRLALSIFTLLCAAAFAQTSAFTSPLPTGVRLDPVGDMVELGSMPLNVVVAPSGEKAVVVLSGWREQGISLWPTRPTRAHRGPAAANHGTDGTRTGSACARENRC